MNKQTFIKNRMAIVVLLALIIGLPSVFLGGYFAARAAYPSGATPVFEHPIGPYSYVIWNDGGTYYAKNESIGEVEFEGTVASTVIQDAIDATNSAGDGTIYVKAGYYSISTTIQLKEGVDIEGEGWRSTTFDNDNPNSGLEYSVFRYEEAVTIEEAWKLSNFAISGYGTDAPLISIHPADNNMTSGITLQNLWLRNAGVDAGTSDYSHGVYFRRVYTASIITCQISGNQGNGVYLDWCNGIRIFASRLQANVAYGLHIKQGVSNSVIGGTIENNGAHGANVWFSSLTTFDQVYFEANTDVDVFILSATYGYADHNIIINCYFSSGTTINVRLASASPNSVDCTKILNNWFNSGGGATGIYIADVNVTNTVIKQNYIAGGYSVELADNGSGTRFVEDDGAGSATIANGQTSVQVTHGLSDTPDTIILTGSHAEVVDLIYEAVGATYFNITTTVGATSGARTVDWYAEVNS